MRFFAKYVPVAQRRAQAAKLQKSAQAKGKAMHPVLIEGRHIAHTFWGKAWCESLEQFSDLANRLPRGKTYVRNGSVIDLQISKGKVSAQVMGSSLYKVTLDVEPMHAPKWKSLVKACAGKIDSLIDLLQGKFTAGIMSLLIDRESGLFPHLHEMKMRCSCPDYAGVCKHIAAVFYGIGARLDTQPEWLFALRHVDHLELIASANVDAIIAPAPSGVDTLGEEDLSSLFGIEMAPSASSRAQSAPNGEQGASYRHSLSSPKRTVTSPAKPLPVPPMKKKAPPPVLEEDNLELTVSQAALLLQISPRRLNQLLDDEKIPFRKVGTQRRIAFEEIVKYRKK